ncbi:MAG: hypothetical protein AB7U63_05630 [Porticoccaceae bacterium]|jgi:hypothetical protein
MEQKNLIYAIEELGSLMRLALVLLLCSLAAPALQAETILIPLGQQQLGAHGEELPRKGELKASVKNRFGEAINISTPVGNPPITTWEYADFFVYFEYDHVIHAVVKFRPQHPEALD